ncbi:SdpI family protein [Propionibacterium cyclohexanicum]|uniref:SdpI family protein n=1 Tax=Propionibacterium cyclohexanicum TaxID=64702 RepID=UPI0015A5A71A|nr:SdpI family protein [Propionibacterium cyclohexanicum]
MTTTELFSQMGIWIVGATILIGLSWGLTAWYQKGPKGRRNSWAGFRFQALFKSDEAWKTGHKVAFKQFCLNVISIWVPSIVLVVIIKSSPVPIGIILIVLCCMQMVWFVVASRMAINAALKVTGDK